MRRILLVFTALSTPVWAQQAIPDTIVTGTRVPVAMERVPAATSIISRADIEDFGYRTLADFVAALKRPRKVMLMSRLVPPWTPSSSS
jgi:vitamin B12 transporter